MILLKQDSLKTKAEQSQREVGVDDFRNDWLVVLSSSCYFRITCFLKLPCVAQGSTVFRKHLPWCSGCSLQVANPILNSGNPGLFTHSGKTENKPWQTKSQRALLRGKCKQLYILFIDSHVFFAPKASRMV